MENQEILNMIANADLSEEQRNALLKELANKIIREKNTETEKTWEEKHEETIKKANEDTAALKERIEGYKERDRKEEEERIKRAEETERNNEIEEKAGILGELRNNNGEKIYNTHGMSGYQIESDYDIYKGTKELEQAKKIYEENKKMEIKQTPITIDGLNEYKEIDENPITIDGLNEYKEADKNPITMDGLNEYKEADKNPITMDGLNEFKKIDTNPINSDNLNAIRTEEPKKEGLGRKLVKSISTAYDRIRQGMEKFKQVAYDETKLGNNNQSYTPDNVRVRN